MQMVRKSLNVGAEFRSALIGLFNNTAGFGFRGRQLLLQGSEMNRQQRDSLIDIVMKLAGNPSSFLLMSFDQPAAHAGKGLFRLLVFGNINRRADVTCKGSVRVESWYSQVEDQAIFPVVPSQTVFHSEGLFLIEGSGVGTQAVLYVVRVNSFRPAVSEFRLQ